MKLLALASLLAVNLFAVVRPIGTHVPTLGGEAVELVAPVQTPEVRYFTVYTVEGFDNKVGSFDLHFESSNGELERVHFVVQSVEETKYGAIKYQAVEQLKNIPPHVRIAPRRIEVSDHLNDLRPALISHRFLIQLKVHGERVRRFGSNPEYVAVPE